MAQPSRSHGRIVKPPTPSASMNEGWHGIAGARHIPKVGDPALLPFMNIMREWRGAGIEMTEDLMVAAVKLAHARLEEGRRKDAAIQAAREREAATQAALDALKPGSYGDAPGGVVYYIRRGQYVKIGTTTNLRNRMRDLMPDEVLAIEPGSYDLEATLHATFARIRLSPSMEYFHLTEELRAHITAVVAKHGSPPPDLPQFSNAA
ncbi:GIY-YIG nuclease family protein [Streptomyces sp. NPDC127091]|uniref:GIY-YIG nuclease family protein n=1 Tax=Streptomyces sp. NPDC127091 TaxID=3347134 RepID=UPI00365FA464